MRGIRQKLRDWCSKRNECPDEGIYLLDAYYAEQLGLPTLASLNYSLDRLSNARDYISRREMEDMLRKILQTATGEATERIRIALDDPSEDGAPGVPEIPALLLERNDR